jgi:hypothetical protein
MRNQRHREDKILAQSHTAGEWQWWDSNSEVIAQKYAFIPGCYEKDKCILGPWDLHPLSHQ